MNKLIEKLNEAESILELQDMKTKLEARKAVKQVEISEIEKKLDLINAILTFNG